ncbi:MAG: glycoside hydrolase family 2 [Clostridia bacterium]|nr:glycoside hydrolase family 2 [Clostridia bacterium]
MSTEKIVNIPRPEHPRPDFVRETFYNLNGTWQFAFDDKDEGVACGWMNPGYALPLEIVVPFAYQTKASGLGPTDAIHPVIWYRRSFTVPAEMAGKRVLLRFGAVDFACTVYVNGRQMGQHKGGYTPFAMDITTALVEGENDLCVRVQDDPDCTQPRGKQYWAEGLMGCWYTPVSGIWQTVYLEAVGEYGVKYVHVTPDIDNHMFTAEIALDKRPACPLDLELTVTFEGKLKRKVRVNCEDRITRVPVDLIVKADLDPIYIWQPGTPFLYDLKVRVLKDDVAVDSVDTYFGMRKVEVKEGRIYLNNNPLYQRLILDQGYWPESTITPPSDEAIKLDLQYTLDFGYNGARKHQKLEDPRYYYWADKIGVLVWGELPSPYDFSDDTIRNLAETMMDFIDRDFNHPCIITWVPLNESWGVRNIYTDKRQQSAGRMLYHMTKAADGTRLCSSNDGWEQVTTDICALHDYAAEKEVMAAHFADRAEIEKHSCDWRAAYAVGEKPTGKEAFMVTEYGGIAFQNIGIQGEMGGMQTWGYGNKMSDEESFFERFKGVTDAIREIPFCQGFCYTQLTDVMQEINGVLSPDRKPKIDVKRFKELNTGVKAKEGPSAQEIVNHTA